MFSLLLHPFKCLFSSPDADNAEHVYAGQPAAGVHGSSTDQAGTATDALPVSDWPGVNKVSASIMASPKRKRGDLQAEADENLIQQYTTEPAAGRKRPVLDPALVSAEAFTLRSPSKSIPRTPVTQTGNTGVDAADSFKFATPVLTDTTTPIGGGVFLSSKTAAEAVEVVPSKLALVPEAPEGDKIKAQHSMGADLADVAQEEHAAKKLKPTDGSSDLQTPLLQDKEKSMSEAVTPGYVVSASEGESPQVSGISNPATNFKEGKAVRVRGTPFETRMEKEMEREGQFSSGAKADFRGRLSDIVANQAMQLRSSPAPSKPWR